MQRKYCSEPVELLVEGAGTGDVLKVDVRNLSYTQSVQMFDRGGLRSVAAQRAFLEDKRAKEASAPAEIARSPYTIRGHQVTFRKDCTFDAKTLAGLVAEISR